MGSRNPKAGSRQTGGDRARRGRRIVPRRCSRIVGAFLCLAAGLKIFELYDYPHGGIGERALLVASGVELLLGVALLLRVWPRVFVPATALLFIAPAATSMIGAGRDVRRCGCLGPITMPPWAMMILDGAAATALIWTLLGSGRWRDQPLPRLAAASIMAGFVGVTIGSIQYRKPLPNTRYLSSQLIAESDVFTITPDRFKDRPFYLADFIGIDGDLRRGNVEGDPHPAVVPPLQSSAAGRRL